MSKTIIPRTIILKMIQEKRTDKETVLSRMKIEHKFCFDDTNAILEELQYGGLLYVGKYVEIQNNWQESRFAKKYFKDDIKAAVKEFFNENKYQRY